MSAARRRPDPPRSPLADRHPVRPPEIAVPTPTHVRPAPPISEPEPEDKSLRGKLTININNDTANDARNAFTLDRDRYRTFSEWLEEAIKDKIQATMDAHDITTLPQRPGPIPTGRPLK